MVQIDPIRIEGIDQLQLPVTLPLLHLRLALPGILQIFVKFLPNEEVAALVFSVAIKMAIFMLVDAQRKFAGDAKVGFSSAPVCHQINMAGFH